MKLTVDTNEAIVSNVGNIGEFKIRNSAKAFKILSDGLYSNKIRAIIRELSCNALDSHVAAGKAEVPFEVHLPTLFEPWFHVRDFGVGLDHEQVVDVYTTYFESTKTDSNDFIGALGLGSKSPFSYTENFTVTAIKNGTKRIYSAFINEMGVPSIAEMSVELTDECNGLEVKFAVINKYDYQSFKNEARYVYSFFKNKPIITGVGSFEHKEIQFKEKDIVDGISITEDKSSYAIMGNIPYPLNNIPEPEKHFGSLSALLKCGLMITFNIGELDFSASREQLSYCSLTINSIKSKLELLNANLYTHFLNKVNSVSTDWEKAFILQEHTNDYLYKACITKYVTDNKFELYDLKSYSGLKTFNLELPELEMRGLEITGFTTRHNSSIHNIKPVIDYRINNSVKTMKIPVEKDVVIVLNDLKTGAIRRARYHYSRLGKSNISVFCISHTDNDLSVRQEEYDKILKELHNPPVVVKASELEKLPRKVRVSSQGLMTIRVKRGFSAGTKDGYTWEPLTGEIDEDKTYYYVTLNNHTAFDKNGKDIDLFDMKANMDLCLIPEIKNIQIIGVRKSKIKEIEALDNWIWFEDALKDATSKISNSHLESLVVAEMLDSYYNRVYTNKTVANIVDADSYYRKYVEKYTSIKRMNGNVNALIDLCKKYGNSLHIDAVKDSIKKDKDTLYTKYPMLKYVDSDTDETEVADYIKMVDKMEKTK